MEKILDKIILGERYKLLNLLKRGGMGVVYLAEDFHLDRICAIKELVYSKYRSKEELKQAIVSFKKEAKILADLHHSNLPKVYDYFIVKNKYFLVMDYIEGKDLLSILNEKGNPGLPAVDVIEWLLQLCEVLSYLHSQEPPIVYRDLKPSNIMLREKDKKIILIDFGIAIINHGNLLPPEENLGTIGYVSPEQCKGTSTHLSDIYSLGATAYHLLTGFIPPIFVETSIRDKKSDISVPLEQIITRCLKIEPSQRYQKVEDIYNELIEIKNRGDLYSPSVTKIEESKEDAQVPGKEVSIGKLYDTLYSYYSRKSTLKLIIKDEKEEGEVYFNCGNIEHARIGSLTGEKALHSILVFKYPKVLISEEKNQIVTIPTPTRFLLDDFNKKYDEMEIIKKDMPYLDLDKPLFLGSVLKGKQDFGFSPFEIAVIAYLKNKFSIRQIAVKLDKSYFQILQALHSLYKEDIFTFPSSLEPVRKAFKALIIDDDPSIRTCLRDFLSEYYEDVNIEEASDGIDGCMKLNLFKPDIVFLDIIMPDMNGLELCKTIKKRKQIFLDNIFIVTALPEDKISQIYDMGFKNIIFKPFQMKTLYGKVNNVLNGL